MSKYLKKNIYYTALHESAQKISPSDEQCDRILQNVLSAASGEKKILFRDASEKVRRMAAFRLIETVRSAVLSGPGVAVVAAGLLLVISITRTLPNEITVISDAPRPMAELPTDVYGRYTVDPTEPVSIPDSGAEDADIPTVSQFGVDDSCLYIYLDDEGSGVDWNSVYAEDAAKNRIMPLKVDAEAGMAVFGLPTGDLTLHVADLAGNSAVSAIRVL